MTDRFRAVLDRLRGSLSRKAEDAYKERDEASGDQARSYAEGEAHAYGIAEGEVREAEKDNE